VTVAKSNMDGNASNVGVLARLVGSKTDYQTRRALWGYLFALPWIIGLVVFWGGPILASLYFSFTKYGVTAHLHLCHHLCARRHRWRAGSVDLSQPEAQRHQYLSDDLLRAPPPTSRCHRSGLDLFTITQTRADQRISTEHRYREPTNMALIARQCAELGDHDQCVGGYGWQYHVDLFGGFARRAPGAL